MGVPVRIAELAESMITMAGLVPGKDIPIVFTGLRPGEKLAETLMSEEEEQTQQVRNRICVAHSPPPPGDLAQRLEQLDYAAQVGDALAVKRGLRSLVPTYRPEGLPDEAPQPQEVPAAAASAELPLPPPPPSWWESLEGEAAAP
jgi:FlaA1/EpsC-like NDP-sugar epimerase